MDGWMEVSKEAGCVSNKPDHTTRYTYVATPTAAWEKARLNQDSKSDSERQGKGGIIHSVVRSQSEYQMR